MTAALQSLLSVTAGLAVGLFCVNLVGPEITDRIDCQVRSIPIYTCIRAARDIPAGKIIEEEDIVKVSATERDLLSDAFFLKTAALKRRIKYSTGKGAFMGAYLFGF